MVSQAAYEHGLRVPLAQAEPRPLNTPVDQRVLLPPSPPPHSFSSPVTAMSILQPPEISFQGFLQKGSLNVFQAVGLQSMVTWAHILPIQFTEAVVGQIRLKADLVDYSASFKTVLTSEGLQGGPPPSPTVPQPNRVNRCLVRLAIAMSNVKHAPYTHDAHYADICKELLLHLSEPERYVSPIQDHTIGEESLLYVIQSMHVQAIAVQEIARSLGWCEDGVKLPFLPRKIARWEIEEMIQQGGVRVDILAPYLESRHFNGYVQ